MLTKTQIISKLEQNRNQLREFGVVNLTLFGSYAKDEQKEESDIDLLVDFKEDRGLSDDYFGLLHFLEDLLEKKVDLGKTKLLREELKPYILGGTLVKARI